MIDWTEPSCQVSDHFTVKDCLYLHEWKRLADADDGVNDTIKANLINLCGKLEQVRNLFGSPINVHCMYRSPEYNKAQGIMPNDVHSLGLACDFDLNPAYSISTVRQSLLQVLEDYELRMEQGTTTWVHLDTKSPGITGRYFKA